MSNFYDDIKVTDEEKERWTRLQMKSMEKKMLIYRILMVVVILLAILSYWIRGKQLDLQYIKGYKAGEQCTIEKYGIEVEEE